jgi:hypothetical protein
MKQTDGGREETTMATFRADNTQGYTTEQLAELNRRYRAGAGELMSAHTPGPWNIVDTGGERLRLQIHADSAPVVVAALLDTDDRVGASGPHGVSKVAEANARLIAAAPRMLETLRTFCNHYKDRPWLLGVSSRAAAHLEEARAILRDVEGR